MARPTSCSFCSSILNAKNICVSCPNTPWFDDQGFRVRIDERYTVDVFSTTTSGDPYITIYAYKPNSSDNIDMDVAYDPAITPANIKEWLYRILALKAFL